METTSFYEAIA